jgi:hypothetical protein
MDDAWWVDHIFSESLAAKNNPDAARLVSGVSSQDALGLITRLFSNCGAILAPFTDWQVAEGLVFLGAAGESDWMYYVYDPAVDRTLRCECIHSIEIIYRDCFALRCRSETNRSSDLNALSTVCFMWWDRFPSGGTHDVDGELIEVMAKALQIDHIACQQSALHGLGHWEVVGEARVHEVVDDWLAANSQVSSSLRAYAEAARNGNVQ